MLDYNCHYHVSADTFGGISPRGDKIVGLVLTDQETNVVECYPLDLDIAEDIGTELIRLAKEMRRKERK